MSKEKKTNSTPTGRPTNNPGGSQGEHVRGQVPNMRNPPPPPPPKTED